jgi:hypothetical protein
MGAFYAGDKMSNKFKYEPIRTKPHGLANKAPPLGYGMPLGEVRLFDIYNPID